MSRTYISAVAGPTIIRPRRENGVDWGTERRVLARHNDRELWWQSGHRGWGDTMNPSKYFPSELSVVVLDGRPSSSTRVFTEGRITAYRLQVNAARILNLLLLPTDEQSLRVISKIDRRYTTIFTVLVERPCERCGEPTLNDRFCRECDLEYVIACGSCRECRVWIVSPEFGGPVAMQHKAGCTLKDEPEYAATTDAARWAVFDGRHEQPKEATP